MFRPGGVLTISDGFGTHRSDTFTCNHCQQIVEVRQKTTIKGMIGRDNSADLGGICGGCAKPICFRCAGVPECVPIARRLDEAEDADRRRRLVEQWI